MSLLTVLKGLPLSYNRDLQEDKGPLFDAVETVQDSLGMLASLVGGLTVRGEAMARAAASGFLLATELADYLVLKGVPFRTRSEEHTSELQSRSDLVCRLLLEKKKILYGTKHAYLAGIVVP